ncbi:hypothetical protein O181_046446 [Austropuccinia psidii MF-1]|uniref:Reverse transcriptase Ty1/copia-type domain-containing protein n=1 Tax=Austropuccinia psidii MF-1 TaxID=1389203 RepID=A0A9Q3DLY7_9BASI|nr:hypothetical protein [Austropuccinia psidii MF-1]
MTGSHKPQELNSQKTFAPTRFLSSLRTLICFAAAKGLKFEQLDIKSIFLNTPLEEEVLLAIPQGLSQDRKSMFLRLNKTIYILQEPCAWYKRLSNCFKKEIEKEVKTKKLRQANLFLGIKIHQDDEKRSLSKDHYIEDLLEIHGINNCVTVETPLILNEDLDVATPEEKKQFQELRMNYRSSIGSLNYNSMAARPNISYAVSSLSQFLEIPGIDHFREFIHILRYLRGSADPFITHGKGIEENAIAYSDADWGNCIVTCRSVLGNLFLFNRGLVIWKTKKQQYVSLLSAEAEYKLLCNLASEVLWFQQFCSKFKLNNNSQPMKVYKDNQGCIDTGKNKCKTNSSWMKHI